MSIRENLAEIRNKIALAENGRSAKVQLVAVSKTQPVELIREAIAAGQTHFGENRVQELVEKMRILGPEYPHLMWHQLGPVQTNKVKYLVDQNILIHSMDRFELADAIERRAKTPMNVLVQVNISREPQKSGVLEEDLVNFLNKLAAYSKIKVCGLMAIAENTEDDQVIRQSFRKMKQLYDGLFGLNFENIHPQYLSMGMSGDYEMAIEEGANLVRVGTAVFGRRQYEREV